MRIEYGRYVITSNGTQYVLNEKVAQDEDGNDLLDKNGEFKYKSMVFYYRKMEQLLEMLLQRTVRQSDVTSLPEYIDLFGKTKEDIRELIEGENIQSYFKQVLV